LDHKFLEFYGQYLLNAAQTQKQIEKMSDWMKPGLKGLGGMEEIFKTCYGIQDSQKSSPQGTEMFQEAMEAFQSSFSTYVTQMGWVEAKKYNDLKQAYETLQKKSEDQKKIIDQLNTMLGLRADMGHDEFFKQIQTLGKKQAEQFNDLMQGFAKVFDTTNKPSD